MSRLLANSGRRPTPVRTPPLRPDTAVVTERGSVVVACICVWLALQLFFNDLVQNQTRYFGINVRPDRLMFLVVLALFVLTRARNPRRVRAHAVEYWMLAFFVWGLISSIMSGAIHHPLNRHLSTLFNFMAIPLSIFYVTRRLPINRSDVSRLCRTLILLQAYLGVTAFCEHFGVSSLIYPTYILDPHVGLHFGRARGPFGNAAVMGAVLTITAVMTVFALRTIKKRLVDQGILFVGLIAVYFTYTRSAWVMLIVSFAVLGLSGGLKRRHVLIATIVLLTIYLSGALGKFSFETGTLFSKRERTVGDRENIMASAVGMFAAKPMIGFGYGTFEQYNDGFFEDRNALAQSNGEGNHNAFLGVLAELGLFGGIPYVLVWCYLLRVSWRLAHKRADGHQFWTQLGAANLAIVSGYLVSIQFFDPRFFAFLNSLVFLTSGLVCQACERLDEQTGDRAPAVANSLLPLRATGAGRY